MTTHPKTPKGWRRLRVGAVIKRGDKFWCCELHGFVSYLTNFPEGIGNKSQAVSRVIRRASKPAKCKGRKAK